MGKPLRHIGNYILIAPVLAGMLLVSCTPLPAGDQPRTSVASVPLPVAPPSPAPTTTHDGFISETTAMNTARQIAMRGEHYLGGAEGPLANLHAELASLTMAQQRLVAQGWPSSVAEPSDRIVWFVTMEGTWKLIGGPPAPLTPVPTSPPQDFHYFVVFLDAKTGGEISIVAR